ncbi:peptide chain release factor N(5)-glutamine methyltransferase [Pareuzebyella sediminis]|uniref:peptide chain release factor N(5)-glutamine methyltransferase n=1 Tax=Pareuzebyella sediminis TaxID=2607998 RepID=UPI0011EE16B1|nr:peptide chain release factor N(5)-glutamine methyltransferase [Pareuzebyella sediminis]
MQLKAIKNIFHKELKGIYPKEEIDSFFYLLIEHFLHLERFVLTLQPNLVVTKDEEEPLFKALAQLSNHRPVQYIIGSTTFMDMNFMVNENVLIPRPETEELVRWIIDDLNTKPKKDELKEIRVLDIGTGSGCIAISLAKHLFQAKVVAVDISRDALKIAKKNALSNNANIDFEIMDILAIGTSGGHYDVIVSNPPYVRESERNVMRENVLDYEPATALFVPDEDPLVFYRAIIQFSKNNLVVKGLLFLEINQYLGETIVTLLKQHNFSEIELRKDMFGNDRFIKCRYGR